MDFNDLDFEGNQGGQATQPQQPADVTNLHGGDTTNLGGGNGNDTTTTPTTKPKDEPNPNDGEGGNGNQQTQQQTPSTGGLEVGTVIEFDGTEYTIAENGDLVDAEGKVFKKADEVQAFIDSNSQDDNNDGGINIADIQAALGADIVDEEGKPVEFTNDADGVKSYVDSVINLRTQEIQNATLNTLFEKMPIVKDFINYISVNNGDYTGFGQLPDRSGVEIDENNETQQETIIRIAFNEFGKKGNVDAYIKYLKDSGSLLDVAKEELEAIKEKDKALRDSYAQQAKEAEDKEIEALNNYWNSIKKTIDSRVIGGYKIPESMILERDGKKITVTPNDFFNYISKTNKEGYTDYQNDLNKMTDEEVMNKEILDAWLHFTGGSYKDLVDMAIKEEQVKRLVLKSKNNKTTRTVRIDKPKSGKVNYDDIILS